MNTDTINIETSNEIFFHILKRQLCEKIDYNALRYGERERMYLFSTFFDANLQSQHTIEIRDSNAV